MTDLPTSGMLEAFFAYAATTGGITVRVAVNYMPEQSAPADKRWFWAYHVRIENHGDKPVQLISRHWVIEDGDHVTAEVRGDGVVGEMPVIAPGESHDYVSGCPLDTPRGTMQGSYQMIDADGRGFEVAIPLFDLSAPRG
ncbi:Co2+/Mg2+ efflux protein ApaG [Sphingomicrobium astaxanthinifaciens]|uniref:Co2+/Mg2+ efflux protein ApaG n=1 Tax=Sphingomicrobium astaxanthinifaciens TaxID=1227949 RepID=UPI001FCC014E|nr:Co2+/Mg2+ efflux protein ApaG [Sphingomicrobium astaxanthinifaciens]MCJ7420319.1 Co2+/Mg2+ efflux protein ApaG [Sphingomicrobium astaxanthinifaciens]